MHSGRPNEPEILLESYIHTRLVGQCSRLSRIAQRSCAGKAIPVQRSCAASTFWRVQIGSTCRIGIKTAPVLTLDVHVSMDSRIIIPRDPRRPQVTPEARVPFRSCRWGPTTKASVRSGFLEPFNVNALDTHTHTHTHASIQKHAYILVVY